MAGPVVEVEPVGWGDDDVRRGRSLEEGHERLGDAPAGRVGVADEHESGPGVGGVVGEPGGDGVVGGVGAEQADGGEAGLGGGERVGHPFADKRHVAAVAAVAIGKASRGWGASAAAGLSYLRPAVSGSR